MTIISTKRPQTKLFVMPFRLPWLSVCVRCLAFLVVAIGCENILLMFNKSSERGVCPYKQNVIGYNLCWDKWSDIAGKCDGTQEKFIWCLL
jgi:hypothetical protein